MLMLGVQNVRPRYCPLLSARANAWCFALASSEIAVATRKTRSVSKVAANPMACGKTVARPARATPCRHSFHQLYSGTSNRGMAAASYTICETFSSSVILETRSAARASIGRSGSRNAGSSADKADPEIATTIRPRKSLDIGPP